MKNNPQPERRQFGRREALLHGIALIPGRGSVHCVVTNQSDQGAHLEFKEKLVLPPIIRLKIEASGVEHICNVRHQREKGVGVVFVDQVSAEKIISNAEESARRRPLRQNHSHAVSGVRLREEVQAARDANEPPADVRALTHIPGRVIRGV